MPRSSSSTGKRIPGYSSRTGLGTIVNFKPGSRLEILDPYTVRFVFPEPDGGAMARLVLMHIGNRQFHQRIRLGGEELVNYPRRWPVGHGPYKLVEGFSLPDKRTDRVVLEANPEYWDTTRLPRLQRIVFDNTLSPTRRGGVGEDRRGARGSGQ